jgi:hypothetical protein
MISLPSAGQQENFRVSQNQASSQIAKVSDVKPVYDTSAVCSRKGIADFTFYDPGNFVRDLASPGPDRTVINLAKQAKVINQEKREILISRLKPGDSLPENHQDWVVVIICVAALLLTLIRSSKKAFQNLESFFLFRGVNESGNRNQTGLFQWSETIKNLATFIIISLFIYESASWFGFIPSGISNVLFWLICLAGVITAITLRHIICVITGNLSGTSEAFNEYLTGVYMSYQFGAIILAVLTVMISYTKIVSPGILIIAGFVSFGVMYLFRATRLLIIFLNRNLSILYLILYLCALEILPVAIAIRYFSVPG